jgi:uncharacterized membrane protein YcaP (DUF421 family)
MDTVMRVVILYLAIVLGMRLLGKREFGQLSPLELVSLLMIPELVSQAAIGEDYSITNALIAVFTLLSLVFITSTLMHLSPRLEAAVSGHPAVLIAHGKLLGEVLNQERISPEEIYAAMRRAGLDRLERVRWAVLEGDGSISLVPEHESERVAQQPNEKRVA